MVANILLTIVTLGLAGAIAYVMREDYKNEQSFRAFHDRRRD